MNPVIADQEDALVVVGVDNQFMVWDGERLTGDTQLIKRAYRLAMDKAVVELPESSKWVRACFQDPTCAGAIAAMLGVDLRRSRLVKVDRKSWANFNQKLTAPLLSV